MRDVSAAGVKKAGENFTFHRGQLGSFFRTTSERDVPAVGARHARRRRAGKTKGEGVLPSPWKIHACRQPFPLVLNGLFDLIGGFFQPIPFKQFNYAVVTGFGQLRIDR